MNLIPLTEDFAIKELFNNETVRKQFISDVLGIPLNDIRSVRIINPFLRKLTKRQRTGILDVALELNDDTRIDVEMQIKPQQYWNKRNLFYLSKMYTDELFIGQNYNKLKKCVSISILNFNLIEGDRNHSVYTLKDSMGKELTDIFEVHIIELKKKLKDDDVVDDWIRLFTAKREEDFDMIKTKSSGMLEAMETVRHMSLRKELKWLFEQREKARRDRYAEDEYVRDEGRSEGRADIIQIALAAGSSPEEISRVMKIDLDEIHDVIERIEEKKEQEALRIMVKLTCQKLAKGKTIPEIADALETTEEKITQIYDVAKEYAPNYDVEAIVTEILKSLGT